MFKIINKSNLVSKSQINNILNFIFEEDNYIKNLSKLNTEIYLYQNYKQVSSEWDKMNLKFNTKTIGFSKNKLVSFPSIIYYKLNRIEIYLFNMLHYKIKDSFNIQNEIVYMLFHELRHLFQYYHTDYLDDYKKIDNKKEHFEQMAEVDAIEYANYLYGKYINNKGKLTHKFFSFSNCKACKISNRYKKIRIGYEYNNQEMRNLYAIVTNEQLNLLKKWEYTKVMKFKFIDNIISEIVDKDDNTLIKFDFSDIA